MSENLTPTVSWSAVERIDLRASNSRFLCPADIGETEGRSGSGRQAPVGYVGEPAGDHLGDELRVVAGLIRPDRLL